ncbi:MAG: hypothetical protein JNJ78_10035 [Anaerolineae bacterium]|nr:hypothetical protein [Anaerolineae bacterium]
MNVAFFLAADYAAKEQSGKLNVLGIFNRIYAADFPAIHASLYLVIRFIAELGEFETKHDVKIIFVDSDGRELSAASGQLELPKPEGGKQLQAELIIQISNLELPKAGGYEFRVIVNKDVKAILPLDVVMRPDEK